MSMAHSFKTVRHKSEALYKEKGSKFLALAFPVNNENEVIQIIKSVKKEHYNARHHCYAYIIGNGDPRFRSNDDGEPRHTAGDPILNQIRSFKLNNVLVVVVRYFGGTKLGKAGLINAYKTASKEALIKARIIEKVHRSEIAINFKYDGINDVMNFIQKNNFEILTQKYEESCYITGLIPKSQVQEIINDLTGYKNVINVVQLPGR